jgi:hypothetical protein
MHINGINANNVELACVGKELPNTALDVRRP